MKTIEQLITPSQRSLVEEYHKIVQLNIEGKVSDTFFVDYISRTHIREAMGFDNPSGEMEELAASNFVNANKSPKFMEQIKSSNLCCEITLPSMSYDMRCADNKIISEMPIEDILS